MRVKTKKIQGNLEVFNEKGEVEYEILYKYGKVNVKINLKRGKSEDK